MRSFEHVPKEVMNAVTGKEVKDLIEKGVPPLYLRGGWPKNDQERYAEQMALSYGMRRLEGQGGLIIGDGLNHGSPIIFREFAMRALESSRWKLREAAAYRETIQCLADQLLADAQVTYPEAELPPGLGPEQYIPNTPTEQRDLNQPTV